MPLTEPGRGRSGRNTRPKGLAGPREASGAPLQSWSWVGRDVPEALGMGAWSRGPAGEEWPPGDTQLGDLLLKLLG